jgi:F-type H+-transporting ATPase subunit b
MPQFDPSTFASQIFWLIVTFGLLYVLMSRIALPRISEVLEERSERIANDLEHAERLRKDAEQVIEQYEAALAKARSEATTVIGQANQEIAQQASERQAEFDARLNDKIAEAEKRIGAARDEAMGQVRDIAVEASRAVADRLIGTAPSEAEASQKVDALMKETAR